MNTTSNQSHFDADLAAIAAADSVPEILDLVCRITGMGFAAVARVTEDRWIACAVRDQIAFGLQAGGELKVETTLCHEIRQSGQPIVIDSVADNAAYRSHPCPEMYGFQSYISLPILRSNGEFFGTLCAIDPRPARLETPEVIGTLRQFAKLIGMHLDVHARLDSARSILQSERDDSAQREQHIAILAHDLRNPLAALSTGTKLLELRHTDAQTAKLTRSMQNSVTRMKGLIDSVMDFAKGRMGGGVPLTRVDDHELAAALTHVIDELRTVWPARRIESRLTLPGAVDCDARRLGQLLSNLIHNALIHGNAERPVVVEASVTCGQFELSVSNAGNPIPPDALAGLFQPFRRAGTDAQPEGLGLGLYIASQIATAHGGTLSVTSDTEQTRFTLRMPAARAPVTADTPAS